MGDPRVDSPEGACAWREGVCRHASKLMCVHTRVGGRANLPDESGLVPKGEPAQSRTDVGRCAVCRAHLQEELFRNWERGREPAQTMTWVRPGLFLRRNEMSVSALTANGCCRFPDGIASGFRRFLN